MPNKSSKRNQKKTPKKIPKKVDKKKINQIGGGEIKYENRLVLIEEDKIFKDMYEKNN